MSLREQAEHKLHLPGSSVETSVNQIQVKFESPAPLHSLSTALHRPQCIYSGTFRAKVVKLQARKSESDSDSVSRNWESHDIMQSTKLLLSLLFCWKRRERGVAKHGPPADAVN